MREFNIYLTGVGGQGIGLLSEVLLRSADHAGLPVIGVDTHGLAQRGGVVVSHLRLGDGAHSPLVGAHQADLVVALERHEALRGADGYLKAGGTLVYYDTVWQPMAVRLDEAAEGSRETVAAACRLRGCHCIAVFAADLPDVRMQNVAVLADLAAHGRLPGVAPNHFRRAMDDLLAGRMLADNLNLFDRLCPPSGPP